MKNIDIRRKSKEVGVPLWQVAEHMRICDMTLSRRMRHELPPEEKAKIFSIIERLKAEREGT